MLYAIKAACDLDADLIIQDGNNVTYVCKLNPSAFKEHTNEPVEFQKIWQIKKVAVTTYDQQTATVVLYPNGDMDFNYSPQDIETYNFQYRK